MEDRGKEEEGGKRGRGGREGRREMMGQGEVGKDGEGKRREETPDETDKCLQTNFAREADS